MTVMDNPEELPPFLTPAELAKLRRTTPASLSQERYRGHGVPFIRDGRRILYARSEVLDYLDRNRAQRTDDPRPEPQSQPRGVA